jgi:hypothetical protein
MVALKTHLNNLVQAELYKFGKANKILTASEFEALKEAGTEEEVNIDSSLYNKALLARLEDKELNRLDILHAI